MNKQEHWENIYETTPATEVSWFAPHLEHSLEIIETMALRHDAAIIDIGGGSSTLVDDLLERGFKDVSVLDFSSAAITITKERLGERADNVSWINGDVTQFEFPENKYDLWHDRAVFHFLTDRRDRELYLENLRRALSPGGHFVLAVSEDDGPPVCDGLAVARYGFQTILATFRPGFVLAQSRLESHQTPSGEIQNLRYVHFRFL